MKDIFAIPYQYINDVGFRECALLLYFIKQLRGQKAIPGRILINKKQMCSDELIKFVEESCIDSLIDKLYNFGFIHFHRKSGRKTRIISVSVVNMVFYELAGKDQYLANLSEYETKKYCGKIIPYNIIDSMKFNIPEYKSMTSSGYYIDYSCGIEEIIKQLKNTYTFDIQKIDKFIDAGGNFIPEDRKCKNIPVNVCSMFGLGMLSIEKKYPLYHGLLYGMNVKINISEESEDSDDCDNEPTLKELARNSYEKYCEYLNIGSTMKKPIMDWNSKDFVSYIYCGLAKLNENDGDFVFPDFAKDCTRMKKLMDKYGNKRLNRVIYLMVKNTDEMIEFCKFKDFKPTPSILSVDWMFDKMLDFSSYIDKEKAQKDLTAMLANNISPLTDLKNQDDSVKLKELRETFNKNKETK